MDQALVPTIAALLGAIIGGLLSVLASWLAQRVQARAQWMSQEILRRQQLYSEFIEAAARCYADALQRNEPNTATLARLYGEIGRMRLHSSPNVITAAYEVAHKILEAYSSDNRSTIEVRDLLAQDTIDLFTAFGEACRTELTRLEPLEHRH